MSVSKGELPVHVSISLYRVSGCGRISHEYAGRILIGNNFANIEESGWHY